MPNDFSKYQNPYDFANPVKTKKLLFGRNQQLNEINYYLDEAVKSKRPINLAFVGDRASGKTSLLNITEEIATGKGCITTRINLDESDIKSEFKFFQKLFHSVFYTIIKKGFFNGLDGMTYKTFEDMVYYGKEPNDASFCPCHFPSIIMRSMQNGQEVSVQDQILEDDFHELFNETKKPIVILMDECDVLSGNKTILQKLRNIFMNLDGYMLVFASTPLLFPALDDVFSPIIRQFKKIEVGGFSSTSDTKDCILEPLIALGIDYREILDFKSFIEIKKIHEICGGRPYEIQLICHFMFKRVQLGSVERMILDLSVLEDVRAELESTQNINARPILKTIQNLSIEELRGLSYLSPGCNLLSFDELWQIQSVTAKNIQLNKDTMYAFFNKFISLRIFSAEDDQYLFTGDDFDKLYIKYFAQEKGINLIFDILNPGLLIHLNFTIGSSFFNSEVHFFSGFSLERTSDPMENLLKELQSGEVTSNRFFDELYWVLFDCKDVEKKVFYSISLSFAGTYYKTYFYAKNESDIFCDESSHQDFLSRVEVMKVEFELIELDMSNINFAKVHDILINSSAVSLIEEMTEEHFDRAIDSYLKKDLENVKSHCKILFLTYNKKEFTIDRCNNFAYLLMNTGEPEKAYKILESALNSNLNEVAELYYFLINYNFLIVKFMLNGELQYEQALTLTNELKILTNIDRKLLALNIIQLDQNNGFVIDEVFDIDLLDAYNNYVTVIESAKGT